MNGNFRLYIAAEGWRAVRNNKKRPLTHFELKVADLQEKNKTKQNKTKTHFHKPSKLNYSKTGKDTTTKFKKKSQIYGQNKHFSDKMTAVLNSSVPG